MRRIGSPLSFEAATLQNEKRCSVCSAFYRLPATRTVRCFSVLAFSLGLFLFPTTAPAQSSLPETSVREQIRVRVEAERRGLDAFNIRAHVVHTADAVMDFYEHRGFEPVWTGRGAEGPASQVDELLTALRRADREGLHPSDYHVQEIASLYQAYRSETSLSTAALTDLELLCTDAFLLYASDLLSGRVSATEVTSTWNIPHRQADLLELLHEVAADKTVEKAFAAVRPQQPEYKALVDALQRYRALADGGGWPTVPDGPKLERGVTSERVGQLRQRLAATGDLASPESAASEPATFDAALHEAVMRFQARHGLTPDGIVGTGTRIALNVPAKARVQQLKVNLERWRWMPGDLGPRHILVNIAAGTLRLVENGEDALTMRVVTGTPYRQTPVFSDEISYLVFNPFWHVPHSIASQDKLAEIQKDVDYLESLNFKVFDGWGADARPIDPWSIDWSTLSPDHFPYRMRQDPGPNNALGRVKFMFPNPHNVYLHDTPTRGHFAASTRTFSSGCIRLEKPIELAERLLSDHADWTPQRIQSVLKTDSTEQSVPLRTRIPVHLQYWTAWTNDDTVHFRSDVYSRDNAVQTALSAPPPTK